MKKIYYGFKFAFVFLRFWFRFLSGRTLSGERKTDSTFTRPATRSLDPSHTMLRWEKMRGASRLAWRIGGLYLLLLLGLLLLLKLSSLVVTLPNYLRPSFLLLAHLAFLLLLGVSYLLRRHMIDYGYSLPALRRNEEEELRPTLLRVEGRKAWRDSKVLPVARAAAVILATSIPDAQADRWVTVPKNYREPGGKPVVLQLPSSFTGADEGVKKRLLSSVNQRLGMKGAGATWQLEGDAPRVLISSPPTPPDTVTFPDVRRFLEATAEWEFFYGVTGASEAFSISISGDTPHGVVSAGSGGGKSTLLKGKVMQAGHKGWFTVIMDWKEESQEWAEDLPGVRYVRTTEAIHDMCVALGDEVEWRKANKGAPRVRTLIVAEEWSITAPLLTEYWSYLRSTSEAEERKQMPLRSPAITSLMKVIFAGRSLGLFLELVAIRFSARVTNGNADLRESFQVINMNRWKPATEKMLAPHIKPFPKNVQTPGRWVAVNGTEAVIYQAPLYTDDEAREWHQSGIPVPASPWTERYPSTPANSPNMHATLGDQLGDRLTRLTRPALEARPVSPMKLSDLWEGLEYLDVTLAILRHGAKSDPEFPGVVSGDQFNGYRYSPAEVSEWARKRHAARLAEKGMTK